MQETGREGEMTERINTPPHWKKLKELEEDSAKYQFQLTDSKCLMLPDLREEQSHL